MKTPVSDTNGSHPDEVLKVIESHSHDPKICTVYGCLMCKAVKQQ